MPSDKKLKSLKKKYTSFFGTRKRYTRASTRAGEQRESDIYSLLKEAELESSLEGTYPVLRVIMEANMLQKLNETKDMSDQKVRELEGSLGLVLQSIREIKTKLQAEKVEVKRDPVVLMVDNLTKAKRALTVTKQLCPT